MKKKSKFFTVMLSFCPGLGQLYLGYGLRGGVFFLAVLLDVFLTMIVCDILNMGEPIFLIFLPLIWLASLVDSVVLADKVNDAAKNAKSEQHIEVNDRKLFALVFSMVPGAGHMYLGMMNKGVQLMFGFFAAIYLTDFLRASIFLIFIPVIWFYSVFDVLRKVSEEKFDEEENIPFLEKIQEMEINKNNSKKIGIILMICGTVLVAERIIAPIMDEVLQSFGSHVYIAEYMRTGIVAMILILGGIRLIVGSKKEEGEQS